MAVNNLTSPVVPLMEFSDLLAGYFTLVNPEYVTHAKKIIVKILGDVYDKGKPPALAMEEILWYLADAFPDNKDNLNLMENLCQNEIAKLEND